MTNQHQNSTTKTKQTLKINLAVLGLAVIALAVGAVAVDQAFKKTSNKISVKLELMKDEALNFAGDSEVMFGKNEEIFLPFSISASDNIKVSQIIIDAKLGSKLIGKIKNWQLWEISYDDIGDVTTTKITIDDAVKNKQLKLSKLNISIDKKETKNYWLVGNVPGNIDSGNIKLAISDATAKVGSKSSKKPIKVTTDATGPKLSIVGKDAVPKTEVTFPQSGTTAKVGSSVPITWTAKNYSLNKPVIVSLMRKRSIAGFDLSEPVTHISINADNTGKYDWVVPAEIEAHSDYFVQVDCGLGIELNYGCQKSESGVFAITK